jgi:hypothetical protein
MYVCIMRQCFGVGTSYGFWLALTNPCLGVGCYTKHQKSILPPKTHVRPNLSSSYPDSRDSGRTCPTSQPFSELTKHIRFSCRIQEAFPGYVRPPARICPTLSSDMFDLTQFLSD